MRGRGRYALTTLAGPWIAVVMLGVDMGIALMRGSPYLGEGMWTVRWMAIGLWVVWPVIAAVAAVDAARLTRPGVRHLPLTARHGAREYVWAAAWAAGPAVVVHALVTLTLLLVGAVASPRVGWGPMVLAILAQASTLVWFAAAGSFIGRHAPALVAGITAVAATLVLSFLLTNVAAGSAGFEALGDSGASVSQIGLTWNVGHLVAQILLLSGTAWLLLLARPRVSRGRLVPSLRGVTSALLTGVLLVAAPSAVSGAPLTAAPEAPTDCTGSDPDVCVFPEHRRNAAATLQQVDALVQAARAGGYDSLVPERVLEVSRRFDAADGRGTVSIPTIEPGPVDLPVLVAAMLTPTWCPQLSAEEPPPEQFWAALGQLVFTWTGLVGAPYDPLAQGLVPLTPEQVAHVLDGWAGCDLTVGP